MRKPLSRNSRKKFQKMKVLNLTKKIIVPPSQASLFCQAAPDLQKLSLNILVELQKPHTGKEEEHESSSPTYSSVRTSCSGRQEERCTHSLTNDGASVLDSVRAVWRTWLQRQQAGWRAWCPCQGRQRWRWFKRQDDKFVCFQRMTNGNIAALRPAFSHGQRR